MSATYPLPAPTVAELERAAARLRALQERAMDQRQRAAERDEIAAFTHHHRDAEALGLAHRVLADLIHHRRRGRQEP